MVLKRLRMYASIVVTLINYCTRGACDLTKESLIALKCEIIESSLIISPFTNEIHVNLISLQ